LFVVRDVDLFSSLLGLTSSWSVSSVDLLLEDSRVVVTVEHEGPVLCSVCGKEVPAHDHSSVREWRHLDTMQFATIVKARIPRGKCPDHGVKQVKIPWADPGSHLTRGFEEWIIRVLELTKSQVRTARLVRATPHQVHDVMHRAVNRGLALRRLSEIPHVSIDEKSFQKGHRFGTILCDVKNKRVLEVTQGRDEAAALEAFKTVPLPDRVLSVSLDMSESFRNATLKFFKTADLVHDRFHVSMLLSKAVDEVRRAEVKKRPELKKSRDLWLTKEAAKFFLEWSKEVEQAELKPLSKVAKTLDKNIQGLLNYIKWKVTNAYAEDVNGLIQEIKTIARGFRRFENFRIAILFFLGGLQLKPLKSS
jgi:transposase